MKFFKRKIIAAFVLLVGLFLLLGFAFWRLSNYEIIGKTELYEAKTNRVFQFKSEKDRRSYQWQAIWQKDLLSQADKGGVTSYVGQSQTLSGEILAPEDMTYEYEAGEQVIEIDGLRYPTTQGIGFGFNLEGGKTYSLVLCQKISKTEYKLKKLDFTVLSGKSEEAFFQMIEVEE